MGKGTPISQELKENIADDLALGYSFADIADRYGISFSTIRRVKNNSPETVSTPIEPVSEETNVDNIDTSIIPDTEENVKPESQLAELEKSDVHYTRIDEQHQTDSTEQCRTETDYEKQKIYIINILRAELGDINEEIRSFEERIGMLQASLEERRQKQAYLRDFIKSMR